MDNKQTVQYLCGLCSTVLKEESECLDIDLRRVTESCPTCGHSLASTLTVNRPRKPVGPVVFHAATATDVLTFDIKQLDSFYSGIRTGETLCIIGRSAMTLVTRLCVRALLPKRRGGLQSPVLFIDAGNTSDIYQSVSFARQYGMDLAKVLDGIIVSRAFTIHQLASLVITELPEAMKRFGAGMVVISGLLKMFLEDPQVDKKEARRLLWEMMITMKRIPRDVIVVVSTEETRDYTDIFAQFENRVELCGNTTLMVNATSKYRSNKFSLPEKVLKVVKVD